MGGVIADLTLIRRLSALVDLSPEDIDALRRLAGQTRYCAAGEDILTEGQRLCEVLVLQRGWAYRYKLLPDGRRQIIAFLVPGDFIGLNVYRLGRLDFSVTTITDTHVMSITPENFEAMRRCEGLGAALDIVMVNQAMFLNQRLVSLGRRSAYERLAYLLLELWQRLQIVGMANDTSYRIPLTQDLMADAVGLSAVHVNRTLQSMRRDGLIVLERKSIRLIQPERLREVAGVEQTGVIGPDKVAV